MKKKGRISKGVKILCFAFPLAVVSNFYITFKTHIHWVDGPDIYVYGFPFSWISQQTWVNSLERHFFILELVLNLSVFSAFYISIFYLTGLHRKIFHRFFIIVGCVIWIVCGFLIFPFLHEAYICGWWPDWRITDYYVLDRQFYWGIH